MYSIFIIIDLIIYKFIGTHEKSLTNSNYLAIEGLQVPLCCSHGCFRGSLGGYGPAPEYVVALVATKI